MSLALLFHYLLLNMFRMLVHPSSGACVLLWVYIMCCISLVRCVLVLRCGSAGVVWYEALVLQPASSLTSCIRSHYGAGVDSASNRNEYHEYFLELKAAGA